MCKRVLIRGITGQAGSHLANLLLVKGYEVRCLKDRSSSFNTDRIDHLYVDPHRGAPPLPLHYCYITGVTSIIRKIQEVQPEEIYNLAAQSRCRGNHPGVERVACPRSATRARAEEQLDVVHLRNVCEPEGITGQGFACTCVGRGMLVRRQ
jgi:GDPmannose 4,6-dehydratase